jgi:hypothetical protein
VKYINQKVQLIFNASEDPKDLKRLVVSFSQRFTETCSFIWDTITKRSSKIKDKTVLHSDQDVHAFQDCFISFFYSGPITSTNKTDRHAITKILLKVALNTINQTFILLLLFEFLVLFWVSCLFWNSICIVILIFCGYYGNQNWIPYKSRIYETIIYFRMDMKVFRKCFTSSINFEKKSFYGIIDLLTNLIAWCLSCVNRMCCLSKRLV